MNIFQYTWIRIKRRMPACLGIILSSLCLTVLICLIQQSIVNRQNGLKDIKKNIAITCTVSSLEGTKVDGLAISKTYIDLMTDAKHYPMSQYIRNLLLKKTVPFTIPGAMINADDGKGPLIGITQRSAEPAISNENVSAVSFDPGYGDTVFGEEGFLCVVGEALTPYVEVDSSGIKTLKLWIDFSTDSNPAPPRVYCFTVVGSVTSDTPWAIYCNWKAIDRIYQDQNALIDTDSMAFILADNDRLDEFRKVAVKYFIQPDFSHGETVYDYALTIHDETYLQTISSYEKNILILTILRPLLFLCSACIGSLVSFLTTRARRKEWAVLSSMGTPKRHLLAQGLIEMFILCMIGMCFGVFLFTVWMRLSLKLVGIDIIIYVLCYMSGAFASIARSLSVPTIKLLREAVN